MIRAIVSTLKQMKPFVLGVLIVVGLAAHHGQARAQGLQTAYFAGGCFWCSEADFEKVRGVREVVSGFTGGRVANPTYRQVVKGGTGHYEAVAITYDPARISYDQLLHLFFRSVDPTDAKGQFCDRGDSYRTAVFVSSSAERAAAQRAKSQARSDLGVDVVTPILEAGAFYPADDYHQDFYKRQEVIMTRFGPRQKSEAYKRYREACGRDQRIRELWGTAAPFAG